MTKQLTTLEMATRYGVTPRSVQYWCKSGGLKSTKIGRDWLIDEEDAREFMAKRETSNKTEE